MARLFQIRVASLDRYYRKGSIKQNKQKEIKINQVSLLQNINNYIDIANIVSLFQENSQRYKDFTNELLRFDLFHNLFVESDEYIPTINAFQWVTISKQVALLYYSAMIIRLILFAILIGTITHCHQSTNTSTVTTNITSPIDAVFVTNSSILIANYTSLFLFDTGTNSIEAFNLTIKSPIINLASTSNCIAICTKQTIYLLFRDNLTLYRTQNLPSFKQYSHIVLIQAKNEVFYIPFSQSSLQFEQSKLNSTSKQKFINLNNLDQIEYFEGHQFVLAADQTGNINLYNISSTKIVDQYKLCNSFITRMKRIAGTPSMLITCENASFITTQNHSLLEFKPIPYLGYPFALVQEQFILLINSTSFLLNNKTNNISQRIEPITNVIHASIISSPNLAIYVIDDNGTLLIINIHSQQDEDASKSMPVFQITAICIGGVVLIIMVVVAIKRGMNKGKKERSYNSQQSQLSLNLLYN